MLLFTCGVGYASLVFLGVGQSFLGYLEPQWYAVLASVYIYPLILLLSAVGYSPLALLAVILYITFPDMVVAFLLFRRRSNGFATIISILTVCYTIAGSYLMLLFLLFNGCGPGC